MYRGDYAEPLNGPDYDKNTDPVNPVEVIMLLTTIAVIAGVMILIAMFA